MCPSPIGRPITAVHSTTESVHIVRGRDAILRMHGMLLELSVCCGQQGAMDDLAYFLAVPGALRKMPYVILVSRNRALPTSVGDVVGVLLLHEYRAAGRGLKVFTTDDTTGRRTLVAPPAQRSHVVALACKALLRLRAHAVLISFRGETGEIVSPAREPFPARGAKVRWAIREREILGYLPLQTTLEATLATLGARTRNHLRYYRRRAETQLGCTFFPKVDIGRDEFLVMNRACAYPASDEIAGWRYDSQKELADPVLMGIRDKDGRWLSVAGGRRHNHKMELYWQMNRIDMPAYSLSTVMRSYLIEHETSQGTTQLYFEGGTAHSIRHAFVMERPNDLVILRRRSPIAFLMHRWISHRLPEDNMFGQMLADKELQWRLSSNRMQTVGSADGSSPGSSVSVSLL
jgi:hypothetical protein